MGFDWEFILGSDNVADAWIDAVDYAERTTGGWSITYATLEIGNMIDEDFCLEIICPRVDKNGNPYLELLLERPGSGDMVKTRLFSPEGVLSKQDEGKIAHVRGTVEDFKGHPYLKLNSIALVEEAQDPAAPQAVTVATLELGSDVDGVFTLQNASVRTASNGKNYFSGLLTDYSGHIGVLEWNYNGPLSEKDSGKRVAVKGKVSSYRDKLRVEATEIKIVK